MNDEAARVVSGPRPDVHVEMQKRLQREWPTLARAIDRLAREILTP